jgi:hypothetical protein
MNKAEAIFKIEDAFNSVKENSNNYGMPEWKWDIVKNKISIAINAIEYLKNL